MNRRKILEADFRGLRRKQKYYFSFFCVLTVKQQLVWIKKKTKTKKKGKTKARKSNEQKRWRAFEYIVNKIKKSMHSLKA